MSETTLQPLATASSSRTRVELALRALGMPSDIIEFTVPTRTSAEAAAAIGCGVEQIAKSIVFRTKQSVRCVLVVASGADRIDEKKLKEVLGEGVKRADADFVRAHTGFVIGGVAPVGHIGDVTVLVDTALWSLDPIWAAAGTPNTVFRLSADDLHRIPGIRVVDVRQAS
ncbi:MAG: prolyl-tRNA editing protein [Betaproteobacteria bacterium HGW-Betaproteobacteria-13]|jgi:prolyl-tRNA editing enzyme YbaK/EbsC (Cys-tRNA(Pro) deacylase)|uniref:Prolyl-tRNA editing protein n=1 Tax=Parazoarcus communis TaxID=41977 RepID=A0A2U8H8F7_9RHOO|nr:YbaK/EbsC family protein [Parazoarcus communis]AWI81416.1 prolyl-tRNA editing protein [Parazoarcus communis]PKO82618.1 MAG: prolyl-tRNA editing protein [Betaproteobacteria bacterium HGW-Betaproteobacteria-13]